MCVVFFALLFLFLTLLSLRSPAALHETLFLVIRVAMPLRYALLLR